MMEQRAVLHFLCAFGVFQKGLTALIQTQQTVMAAEGEEVSLNCQLTQSKEVLQVTWQKLLPDWEENLATCNNFGQRVNPAFRDKVEFKDAGLQNSSIVIKNVTEQDEGCYHCLFNAYPEGALTGETCLRLYELHEPVLHVGGSNSAEEAVVSCSATGRPAPTVTLSLLQRDLHLSNYSSVTVNNANGTVTVTSTAALSGFRGDSTQVGCAARVLSGPQIEVFIMIPEVKQSSADDFNEESGSNNTGRSRTLTIVLSVVVVCGGFATVIFLLLKPQNQNRDCEMNETLQTIRDSHETEAPSGTQENDQIRQRTPVKNPPSEDPNLSPSTSRRPETRLD